MIFLINILGWSIFGYLAIKPNNTQAAPTADGRMVYSINTTTPQHRAYTASSNTFGSQAAMQTGAGQAHMVDEACPKRDEHMAGYVTTAGVLYIQRWNGSSWSAEWNVTVGGNGVDGRRFDIGYEKTTGNAMVVYSNNTTGANELRYNYYNGSSWGGATILDSARLVYTPTWIKLESRPTSASNEIALTVQDSGSATANTSILTTMIWSGSAWGNEPAAAHSTVMTNTVTTSLVQNEAFDMSYENLSGDLLVVWTQSTPQQYYRTYSATTWGTATSMATGRALPINMTADSNPYTDQIAIVFNKGSSTARVSGVIWSGTALGTVTAIGTNGAVAAIEKKYVTTKWMRVGTTDYAVVVWNSSTAGTLGYAYYTGSSWGSSATYVTGTGVTANWMESNADPQGPDTMMVTFSTGAAGSASLWAKRLVLSAGPTFTWTNADGGTAESTALASVTSRNFTFTYNRFVSINIMGTSADLSSGTVAVAIDTAVQTGKTGTISGGTWTIAGVAKPASGAVITVWVTGSPTSSAVTKYNGSGNETGLVLNSHVFSVGSASNQSLILSDIDKYDYNQDTNVIHQVATSTLTVDPGGAFSDETLNILAGNTLTIGGAETATTVNLANAGTLTSGGNSTYNIAGNWTNNNVFNQSTSTVNFNGSDSSIQILTGNTTFNNFAASTLANAAGRTIKFTDGSTTTVSGTWTITGYSGKVIILTRTSTSSAWTISPTAATVTYANVSWSNSGLAICATYSTNGGNNNANWSFSGGSSCNTAPTAPASASLAQKKVTGEATLATGDWTNETQVQFTATTTDPDVGDTLYLCAENDLVATALSSTNGGDLCGTGVANSSPGNPITITVTITGLADASEFHWQVQAKDAATAYSGWTAYGGNTENPPTNPAARDFGVDTTAPNGGTVKDGTISGGDLDWNTDGSLTQLLANWTGTEPTSTVSGLQKYEYALRRKPDDNYWTPGGPGSWGAGQYWYDNGTGTSFTASSLNLATGVTYYVSLRTTDNAGNNATINSNGLQVSPTLSFSFDTSSITFADLNNVTIWTDTKDTVTTVSTNAANGYNIQTYIVDYLKSIIDGTVHIDDFSKGNYASPAAWGTNCQTDNTYCGFGYTVNPSTRFSNGTLFAPYYHGAPGQAAVERPGPVNGSTGAISGENRTITHKVSVSSSQMAGPYQTTLLLIVTPNY